MKGKEIQHNIEVKDFEVKRQNRDYPGSYYTWDGTIKEFYVGWDSPLKIFGVIFLITFLDGCFVSGGMWEENWKSPLVEISVAWMFGCFACTIVVWIMRLMDKAFRHFRI